MKTEPLNVPEALRQGRTLPYALIYSLSRVTLGPTPESVDLDELIEARFFSAAEEVRIFQDETGLQAVRLVQEADDVTLNESFALANRAAFGGTLTRTQTLDFDDDGQAFIACTRLTGWKEGPPNA